MRHVATPDAVLWVYRGYVSSFLRYGIVMWGFYNLYLNKSFFLLSFNVLLFVLIYKVAKYNHLIIFCITFLLIK